MQGFESFKNLLGRMESNNNYLAINSSSGALGKYQFLPSTLTSLQFNSNLPPWLSDYNFLNSPGLQEIYFKAHINDLTNFINNNDLNRFTGSLVRGSKRFLGIRAPLNIYGMLAGAHLAGPGTLRNYLNTGSNPDDGYTSLTDYMAYFSKNTADVGYLIPVLGLAFLSLVLVYYD